MGAHRREETRRAFDKQERDAMKRKGAEGLPAGQRVTAAANEDFTGTVSGADRLSAVRQGWDPYEVWRTRVKATSQRKQERSREPLR
jgi:hypothetical protein